MRKPIMAGNWKMNVDHVEATGLVEKLHYTLVDKDWDPSKSDAVLCVPFTDLRTVRTLIDGDRLHFGLDRHTDQRSNQAHRRAQAGQPDPRPGSGQAFAAAHRHTFRRHHQAAAQTDPRSRIPRDPAFLR